MRTKEKLEQLNTPKKPNVVKLFNNLLGIKADSLDNEIPELKQVNGIVKVRGQIAHNVFAEEYVKS